MISAAPHAHPKADTRPKADTLAADLDKSGQEAAAPLCPIRPDRPKEPAKTNQAAAGRSHRIPVQPTEDAVPT